MTKTPQLVLVVDTVIVTTRDHGCVDDLFAYVARVIECRRMMQRARSMLRAPLAARPVVETERVK